jgi:diguanylate cyclase (GGDEF)-like protein
VLAAVWFVVGTATPAAAWALVRLARREAARRSARRVALGRAATRRRIEHTLDLTVLVDEAVEYGASLLGVDATFAEMWNGDDRSESVSVSSGLSRAELERCLPLLDSLAEPGAGGTAEVRFEQGGGAEALRGAIVANLPDDSQLTGRVVVFWRTSGVRPDERSLGELTLLVAALARAARRRERLPMLAHAPTRDRLTGLHNHRFFESDLAREIERARRHKRRFALLVVDVDDFGGINERLGRSGADAVLAELAGRLATTTRTSDSSARIGRDEFGFILVGSGEGAATQVFERFCQVLERGVGLTNVALTACGGAVEFDGGSRDALLEGALHALESAKSLGPGRLVVDRAS